VNFTQIATPPAFSGTGSVTFIDTTIQPSTTDVNYTYRVAAVNAGGSSAYSVSAPVLVPALPLAPSSLMLVNGPNKNRSRSVILTWADNSNNETGFTIQRATNSLFTQGLTTVTVGANVTTLTQTGLTANTQYWYRIRANNGTIIFTGWVNASPFPILTNP
ncbi:MAG TPA: fibronectin type III domain-containing protein, partial [Geobacteraceae bacterium]